MQIRELTGLAGGGPAALRDGGRRRIVLPRAALECIAAEARAAHPHECCGALFGAVSARDVHVREARAAQNTAADPLRRYEIDARTVRALDAAAAAAGLAVVGYYHSHPGRSAVPSPTDLELALPGLTYLILPVGPERVGEPRAWCIAEDRSRFEEQELDVA